HHLYSEDLSPHPALPTLYEFFSYKGDHVEWHLQQCDPHGIDPITQGVLVRLDYAKYDLQDHLRTLNIDVHADNVLDLQQHYVYDHWGRLTQVYANMDESEDAGNLLASFQYDDALGL